MKRRPGLVGVSVYSRYAHRRSQEAAKGVSTMKALKRARALLRSAAAIGFGAGFN